MIAALLFQLATAQAVLNLRSDKPVQLSAETFECDDKLGRCEIAGDVLLTSGSTVLSAQRVSIAYAKNAAGNRVVQGALATGDVLLVDGDTMTTCERIQLDPDLVQGSLGVAEIRVKKPGSVGALKGWAAYGAGRDIIYFTGRVRRTGVKTFHVDDVYFTPCDCGRGNRPIFSVKAKEANFEVGNSAVFYRPTVQPGDVALPFPFSLPALYVPLSKRKSGLLPPLPRSLENAFYIDQQLFWAPTQDFDMTVALGVHQVRGPRDMLELRYKPDPDIEGNMRVWHLYDLTQPGQLGPHRFTAMWEQWIGTYSRWSLRHRFDFASDRDVVNAIQQSVSALSMVYLPSRLATEYRGDAWRASLGAAFYQDFSQPGSTFGGRSLRTLHRLPEAGVFVAPIDLGAGVTFAADTRLVSQTALTADAQQVYGPSDPGCEAGCDPRALHGYRADIVPRLARAFDLGGLQIRPELFGLAAVGSTSTVPQASVRGFAGTQVELSTHLGRVFDAGGGLLLRHRLRPLARYLLIPYAWRARTGIDERDQFTAVHQASIGLETDLYRKERGSGASRAVYLSLAQGFNLGLPNAAPAGLAELIGRFVMSWAPAQLELAAAVDPRRGYFRQYSAGASVSASSLLLRMSYDRIYQRDDGTGSQRMNTGLFELVPSGAVPPLSSGNLHNITFAASVTPLSGLQLRGAFMLTLPAGDYVTVAQPADLSFGVSYKGVCECFGVGVDVRFLPQQLQTLQVPTILPYLYIGDFEFKAPSS